MALLNLDFNIADFTGEAIKDKDGANLHAGKLLANVIAAAQLSD